MHLGEEITKYLCEQKFFEYDRDSVSSKALQFELKTVLNAGKNCGYLFINPLNAELNPICHLLSLLGGATIVVVSRLRVNTKQFCYKFV
jgi:hypothetical protein